MDMRDSFYARLIHESEDYWMPKGFEHSSIGQQHKLTFAWGQVGLWSDIHQEDSLFVHLMDTLASGRWSFANEIWLTRSSTIIKDHLLALNELEGDATGWLSLADKNHLDGMINTWRCARDSAAKDRLKHHLINFPGWLDKGDFVPGREAYEQYGFCSMMSYEVVVEIAKFIKNRHREIPLYIGGALRLGGAVRARKECDLLFEALKGRPYTRVSVVEALRSSRLETRLYLDHLTQSERGVSLEDALGL
jgi:hypothetical protein